MAITINWGTRVIYVPKADLTLIQETPTEIRELDLNVFRLALKDLEDSEEGVCFPDTHRHNTEVTVAGLTLARVIEIINGYTVTFEDGQYAVNLPGANSNVGDVVNVNQVSVRSFNSAGLISSPAIEYASFQDCVTVNMAGPFAGTSYPTGTRRQPVNNFTDALLIATTRGLNTFFVMGDALVDTNGNYAGLTFIGEGCHKTMLEIDSGANVYNAEFVNAMIMGTLDGRATIRDSQIGDLFYVNGRVEKCILDDGFIVLGGSLEAIFLDCWNGAATGMPTINMGGSGQPLTMRNYSGSIQIQNKSGTEPISISLLAGEVILEDTVTNGSIYVCGNGVLKDTLGNVIESGIWNGISVDTSDLINPHSISNQVWADAEDFGAGGGLTLEEHNQLMSIPLSGAGGLTQEEHDRLMGLPVDTLTTAEHDWLLSLPTETLTVEEHNKLMSLPLSAGGLTTQEHNQLMSIPLTDTGLTQEEHDWLMGLPEDTLTVDEHNKLMSLPLSAGGLTTEEHNKLMSIDGAGGLTQEEHDQLMAIPLDSSGLTVDEHNQLMSIPLSGASAQLTQEEHDKLIAMHAFIANRLRVNKVTGEWTVYDDNGTTPLFSGTIADDGTFKDRLPA